MIVNSILFDALAELITYDEAVKIFNERKWILPEQTTTDRWDFYIAKELPEDHPEDYIRSMIIAIKSERNKTGSDYADVTVAEIARKLYDLEDKLQFFLTQKLIPD